MPHVARKFTQNVSALLALGHTVYVGARDRARGEAAARRLGARFVQLDVTDDASVANVVDPGYTATDLNHHSGPQTVEQGTDAIVRLATLGRDGPTGTFQDAAGILPW